MKDVKMLRLCCEKRLHAILILLLIFASVNGFSVYVSDVSAAPVSPYLIVEPERTMDQAITPGMNYTISIKTDYAGTNVWGWEFNLTFNPDILQGGINTTNTWLGNGAKTVFLATRRPVVPNSERVYVNQVLMTKNLNYTIDDYRTGFITFSQPPSIGAEVKAVYQGNGVVNGDLISRTKNSTARFNVGEFDNTAGKLYLTNAMFAYTYPTPPFVTSGPGTLANVTFTVVGTGYSDITLGIGTRLLAPPDFDIDIENGIPIIDAKDPPGKTEPPYGADHIGNGYFDNIPNIHDLAIRKLVTPPTAVWGYVIAINVTIRNEGNFTENFDATVYANTTIIGTQTSSLARGAKTILTFDWNTTEAIVGNYTINATVSLAEDNDPSDNVKTAPIEIKTSHDVAVIGLEFLTTGFVGDLISINVTVTNEGTFTENVTLTVSYQLYASQPPPPTVIKTINFTLTELRTPHVLYVTWNTTGLAPDSYTINATAKIALDEDLSENVKTRVINLSPAQFHDVAVTAVSAASKVFVGAEVTIDVTVRNDGTFNETREVKVTYEGSTLEEISIGSQSVSLLLEESKTISFIWDTAGVAPDTYAVKANAILDGDKTPDNNGKIAVVIVETPPPPPPGHITGIVKDASTGNPIEGANVTINGYFDVSDANGRYNITNVPVGTFSVAASADGYKVSSQTGIIVVSGETTNLDFNLTPIPTTGHITGIVKDASTGNPIEGANVTINGVSVLTDADGSYSFELQTGTYIVTVAAEGYQGSTKTNILVSAGQSITVHFELTSIQPPSISQYVILAAVGIIIVVGIAIYLYRRSKKTAQ